MCITAFDHFSANAYERRQGAIPAMRQLQRQKNLNTLDRFPRITFLTVEFESVKKLCDIASTLGVSTNFTLSKKVFGQRRPV
jgi:hypothetical protein